LTTKPPYRPKLSEPILDIDPTELESIDLLAEKIVGKGWKDEMRIGTDVTFWMQSLVSDRAFTPGATV
ncbi:hypothetical protein BY996DRAFT_6549606, partial [Phakopsora pachyrhizi]